MDDVAAHLHEADRSQGKWVRGRFRLTPLFMKEIGDAVGTTASAVNKACKAIGSRLAEEEGLARGMRFVAGLLQSETASVASAPSRNACPGSKPLRDHRCRNSRR